MKFLQSKRNYDQNMCICSFLKITTDIACIYVAFFRSLWPSFKIIIFLPSLQKPLLHLQMSINLFNIIRHILFGSASIEYVIVVLAFHVLLLEQNGQSCSSLLSLSRLAFCLRGTLFLQHLQPARFLDRLNLFLNFLLPFLLDHFVLQVLDNVSLKFIVPTLP